MGKLSQFIRLAGSILGTDSPRQRELKTSRALLTIFGTFSQADTKIATEEVEISFDFVRNIFPEADHQVLGKFLERALSRRPPLSPQLAYLKRALTKEQKTAFGLQLYTLIKSGSDSGAQEEAYLDAMTRMGAAAAGKAVIQEMSEAYPEASKILPRLDFGDHDGADIRIERQAKPTSFRCYRAGGIILIRNLSKTPLNLRGYRITKNRLIQLRPSDNITVADWRLNYDDLQFFFNVNAPTLYLLFENGEVKMDRTRAKSAVAHIRFGHRAAVTPQRDNILATADGTSLDAGEEYLCDYHDLLLVDDGEPIALDTLRQLSLQGGHRFSLPAGRRKVIVSNDHSQLSGDSLLLTPGLAGRFILELEFDPTSGFGEITVIESSQSIVANGRIIEKATLPDGSLIRLSSRQALRCRFSENLLDEERNLVRSLEIEGANYAFWKGGKTIDNLSFQVKRGEMACIIGPSGSGKSTLLEILAGQRKPQTGSVRLNGLSLYKRQRRLSPLISFMPQEEALSEQLTTREHLTHACSIRRPHLPSPSITKRVNSLLDGLGLSHIAERRVGSADSKSLSGGERSRLNAGLDLIGGGEIFLFDEPISGLSSKDAEHVIDTLHGLARDKIVIASLHRPSEKVLKSFDKVLLLDRGGKMSFFGPPSDMISYFEEARKELDISDSHQEQTKPQTGADFVFDVLEAPIINLKKHLSTRTERRFPPSYWQERFENQRVMAHLNLASTVGLTDAQELPTADDQIPAPEPPSQGRRQQWQIFKTHFARALKSKVRHRGTLYSIILQAPLLAFLIAYTLHASADGRYEFHSALHLPSYLFLAVTVAMFFGLTNSAAEILRDRPVLRRERNCRPHPLLYLGSKFIVLTVLVIVQSLVFIAVAHHILELHGMVFPHLVWMSLTGCCGTALALLISVIAKSERTALASIPLILVPQILLAGALVPFTEMNRGLFSGASEAREGGAEPVPSTLMPLRYAYEGSVVSQAIYNEFERARRPLQSQIDQLTDKENLSETETNQLNDGKTKLQVLFAASADDLDHARSILTDPIAEMERIQNIPLDEISEPSPPLNQFFVNQRIEGLVELAESKRLDLRSNTRENVFLAEEKSLLRAAIKTTIYCQGMLLIMTIILLATAAGFLKYSLNRH
ncbi:MAG: ATP-binding cassette domain-containing protein [Akkermansiaceae bacterium]